jgi:hypothetical protein
MAHLNRLALAALLCAPLLACHTGSSNTLAGAAVMTTLAGGFSAARRANGECYVDCLPGTRCNRTNGLCEALPCRDKCGPGETCSETETGVACLPAGGMNVQTNKGAAVPRTGASDKPAAAPKEGDKPAAPSAALQPAAAPSAPPRAEGDHQGPTPPVILPLNDPNSPKSGQTLIDSASSPPPR